MVLLVSQSRSSNASQSVTLEVINVQFEINNHFKFQFLSYWFFSNTSVSDQLVTFLQLGWNLMLAWLHKVQHWCLNVSGMCLRNSHGDYFFRLKHISWRSMDPHQHLKQKVQLCWMLLFGSDIWICCNHIVGCLANDSTNFTELGSILLYQSQNVVVYFINSFIYSRKVLSNPLSEQKWCIF